MTDTMKIPKMKLTRALKPKAYTYYDLYDACRWVKIGWPELEDCNFYDFFADEMANGAIQRLCTLEDTLYDDDAWSWVPNQFKEQRKQLQLFYAILEQEFGADIDFEVSW
jgi:hypothetical protein